MSDQSPAPVDLGPLKRLLSAWQEADTQAGLPHYEARTRHDWRQALRDTSAALIPAALSALPALVAELEAAREALSEIAGLTNVDDPNSYRADDREGCLDTVYAIATGAQP